MASTLLAHPMCTYTWFHFSPSIFPKSSLASLISHIAALLAGIDASAPCVVSYLVWNNVFIFAHVSLSPAGTFMYHLVAGDVVARDSSK